MQKISFYLEYFFLSKNFNIATTRQKILGQKEYFKQAKFERSDKQKNDASFFHFSI